MSTSFASPSSSTRYSSDPFANRRAALHTIMMARWFVIFGLGLIGLVQRIGDVAVVALSLPLLAGLVVIPSILNLFSLVCTRMLARTRNLRALTLLSFFHIAVDFFMITAVVMLTGGVESISFTLYILPMLEVTILASDVVIMISAFLGSLLYTAAILAEYYGVLPHFSRYHFNPGFFQNPEITLANTASVVFIMLVSGIFFVFINRIIHDRTTALTVERDKVRATLYSLEDGIVLLDTERRIALMNPPARAILRLKPEDNPSTLRVVDFTPTLRPLLQALRERENKKELGRDIILTEPYHPITIRVDSLPIHNHDGNVISWIKILRDVTREKELDEVKSDFISIAAHQLRTPLSALKWFFQLVLDGDMGKLSSTQKPLFQTAYDRVNQIIEIVNNLLNISEIEEGRTAYTFAKDRLEPLLTAVVESTTLNAKQKHIPLRLHTPQTPLPLIEMDKTKMRIAIQNVVDNAVKYSPTQHEVVITAHAREHDVEITVRDSGIGIPVEEQSRIFEKFFRGSNAKEQEPTGSGLGMYIVRNIVHKHHGDIWFTSQPTKGTTFTLRFPIAATEK